jgi:hypothetical protein
MKNDHEIKSHQVVGCGGYGSLNGFHDAILISLVRFFFVHQRTAQQPSVFVGIKDLSQDVRSETLAAIPEAEGDNPSSHPGMATVGAKAIRLSSPTNAIGAGSVKLPSPPMRPRGNGTTQHAPCTMHDALSSNTQNATRITQKATRTTAPSRVSVKMRGRLPSVHGESQPRWHGHELLPARRVHDALSCTTSHHTNPAGADCATLHALRRGTGQTEVGRPGGESEFNKSGLRPSLTTRYPISNCHRKSVPDSLGVGPGSRLNTRSCGFVSNLASNSSSFSRP